MKATIATLQRGQKAIITSVITDQVPLKLLEMGCLPGNEVMLLQTAPFSCPMYLNVNGSHLAIRKEVAEHIEVEIV